MKFHINDEEKYINNNNNFNLNFNNKNKLYILEDAHLKQSNYLI
jgi:hypothetical protein